MMKTMRVINQWLHDQPRITRTSVTVAFLSSLFLIIGWSKYFFLDPGTFVSFGTSATATIVSLFVVSIPLFIGVIGGLLQLAFIPPRRAGLTSMGAGVLPLVIYGLIMWYLLNVNGIVFD